MIFNSVPASYSSVNSNLVYVVYDAKALDTVTYPNYKYVAELFIGTKVFTAKVFPNTENMGVIDLGDVIREYVEFDFAPASGIVAQELGLNKWSLSVTVKIKEEIDGVMSAVLIEDTKTFYNHYNGRDVLDLASYSGKPLTNRVVKIDLNYSANYFIPYFASGNFSVVVAGGTSTRTKNVTPTAGTLQILNISPKAVNEDYPGNFTTSTESYTVTFGGVTYQVSVKCNGLYNPYTVHFLNKFGGMESMLFGKARKRTYEIERKDFQQLPYRVSIGVVSLKSGSVMHEQKTVLSSRFTESLKINTDLLSDQEHAWLSELVISPLVYLEDNGVLYPTVIKGTNYEFKERVVDNATNLTIEVSQPTFKAQYR